MEKKTDKSDELLDRNVLLIILGLIFIVTAVFSFIGILLRADTTFPCYSSDNLIVTDATTFDSFSMKNIPVKICTISVSPIFDVHPIVWIIFIVLLMEVFYFKVLPKDDSNSSLFGKITSDKFFALLMSLFITAYLIGLFSLIQAVYYNLDTVLQIIKDIAKSVFFVFKCSLWLIPMYLWYKFNATKYKK